jgi:hypothetical protein
LLRTHVEVLGNIGPNWFASVMGTGIPRGATTARGLILAG